VKLSERGASRAAWVSPSSAAPAPAAPTEAERAWSAGPLHALRYALDKTLVVAEMEARKLWHDPWEVMTRAGQPVLWLLVFGQVLTRVRIIPTGDLPYLDFMAPGVLAQSVLFIAIFYGVSAIWERDLGIIHKLLASPAPRAAIVVGKALSASLRSLPPALVVYGLSAVLGVQLNYNLLALAGLLLTVVLAGALFSTMSLIVSCIVRTRERFLGVGQFLTMPMFFVSNAVYPIALMPLWLQWLARFNPLSYEVDALRTLMLAHSESVFGLGLDYVVMIAVAAVLVAVATKLYPRLAV
jgi:ABC-2 type transport system permease protein